MTTVNHAIEAGGATPPATVKVWDPFVRVFHWSLAGLFLLAYATGDEIENVHIFAGDKRLEFSQGFGLVEHAFTQLV